MNQSIVFNGNGKALTNSLLVAQKFGKKHKHVLEAIRNIMTTAENSSVLSMFDKSSYLNEQNKSQPMYIMNRDGFSMLAMGFTGKQAMKFKVDFISAFNQMEESLKATRVQLQPKTGAEMLLMCAQQLVEQERRVKAIESKVDETEQRIAEIEKRTVTQLPYTTIVGYANRFGIRVPLERASVLGRVATNKCKKYGFEMGRVEDPRFGMVKTYPDGVLLEVFTQYYPNVKFQ